MTEDKEKIVDKIQKMLNLAAGAGTEEEAETATRMAHELLAKYNLTMGEVEAANGDAEEEPVYDKDSLTKRRWEINIWSGAAELNFCMFLISKDRWAKGTRLIFIGRPVNVQVAKMTGRYLVDTVQRLAREEAKRYPQHDRKSIRGSFRLGAAARLYTRCVDLKNLRASQETRSETNGGGTNLPALASLYDREIGAAEDLLERLGIKVSKARSSRRRNVDFRGYDAGKRAADGISLDPQVGSGGGSKRVGNTRRIGRG